MDVWVVWLIIAVALGVTEIFTLTAALGLLAGAALVTGGFAALGLPVPLQLLVFAVASAVGLVLVRPVAVRHMHMSQPPGFGVDALVGSTGYVVRDVTGRQGRVRIGGEEWTARAFDESVVIPAGASVNVIRIDGATAVVYPQE